VIVHHSSRFSVSRQGTLWQSIELNSPIFFLKLLLYKYYCHFLHNAYTDYDAVIGLK